MAGAVAINTAIVVVEDGAGFQANSLSLVMDSVHNLSDELALIFLYLAYLAYLASCQRHACGLTACWKTDAHVGVGACVRWQ